MEPNHDASAPPITPAASTYAGRAVGGVEGRGGGATVGGGGGEAVDAASMAGSRHMAVSMPAKSSSKSAASSRAGVIFFLTRS